VLLFVHVDREAPSWQMDVLRSSIARVGQAGELVVRSDRHPERSRYVILDRVLAFERAMAIYHGVEPVAILDPDMALVRSFTPSVWARMGQATVHAANWSMREKAEQMEWAAAGASRQQQLDWPAVMSADDAREIAPLWLEFTERLVACPTMRGLFGWTADMWAFGTAAYKLGIGFNLSPRLTVVPGLNQALGEAWVVHYYDPVPGFDKTTYAPGDEVPAGRAGDEAFAALRAALAC